MSKMKSITKTIISVLLIGAVSSNALADRGREQHRYAEHHRHEHNNRSDWVGPLVLLGIGAVALSAMASQPEPASAPVYVTEQNRYPPAPPPSAGYFCRSVGQYYPNTQYCPEGWLLVQ
jgi:hypothetical protein